MRYVLLSLAIVPTVLATGTHIVCYRDRPFTDPVEEKCLATMIYGEARGEQEIGKVAVAFSAVNRAKGKKSLCNVVLAPKQYSIFNNNPELRAVALSLHIEPKQKNVIDKKSWEKSVEVAAAVVRGYVPDPVKGSTHYISDTVMKSKGYVYPKWSREYVQIASIGNHRFFKERTKTPVNKL